MSEQFKKDFEVSGVKHPIQIDGNFNFFTMIGETRLSAPSIRELEERIKETRRRSRIKVSIPIVITSGHYADEPHYFRAILTGRHGNTLSCRVIVNGKPEVMQHINIVAMGNAITDAQIAELNQLARNVHQAREAETNAINAVNGGQRVRISALDLIENALKNGVAEP